MFSEDSQPLNSIDSQQIVTPEMESFDSSAFPAISNMNSPGTDAIDGYSLNSDYSSNALGNEDLNIVETYDISGINESVTIQRDEFGIPHIDAHNLQDGIFAQGYVQAEDRLWQMEYLRRSSSGTLAEILGEDAVESDLNILTLGIDEAAETAYENLDAEAKNIVDAYAAGINSYLNSTSELPVEFENLGYQPELWQGQDTMAIVQLQNYIEGAGDGGELDRFNLLIEGIEPDLVEELIPSSIEDETTILQDSDVEQQNFTVEPLTKEEIDEAQRLELEFTDRLETFFPDEKASNNWVISGDRTTTGMPFLASDPHLDFQTPSVQYQTEINTPELGIIGMSFPGIPGILQGRNQNIAWGETSNEVDTRDYYFLEETADGSGYIHQGEVKPYDLREETIEIKDGETITVEVKDSIYGPVVADLFDIEQPVALKALGLEPANGLVEAFAGINQASNWHEFTSAVDSYNEPISNFVYADTQGNIGYIAPGNYPIRQPGHTGKYPVPGTGEFDWQGFIPREDVPQLYNPESGYIVTANNRPTPDNYPYQINGDFGTPYRAERITELIESKDKLSFEDMQAIQLDTVTLLYRDFRPLLEQLEPTSEQGREWQQRLLNWDGNTLPDSQEASVFEAWYAELSKVAREEVGLESWSDPYYLRENIDKQEGEKAFDAALKLFGDEIPVWGEIHQAVFSVLDEEVQPENNLQVPVGGDNETVNANNTDGSDEPLNFNSDGGASYRQIIDFSDLENSVYIKCPRTIWRAK